MAAANSPAQKVSLISNLNLRKLKMPVLLLGINPMADK
jgi:hypothetical protein